MKKEASAAHGNLPAPVSPKTSNLWIADIIPVPLQACFWPATHPGFRIIDHFKKEGIMLGEKSVAVHLSIRFILLFTGHF